MQRYEKKAIPQQNISIKISAATTELISCKIQIVVLRLQAIRIVGL